MRPRRPTSSCHWHELQYAITLLPDGTVWFHLQKGIRPMCARPCQAELGFLPDEDYTWSDQRLKRHKSPWNRRVGTSIRFLNESCFQQHDSSRNILHYNMSIISSKLLTKIDTICLSTAKAISDDKNGLEVRLLAMWNCGLPFPVNPTTASSIKIRCCCNI